MEGNHINLLSGEELVKYCLEKNLRSLPVRGLKEIVPNGSWLEQKQIQAAVNSRKDLLSDYRIEKWGVLSHGEWMNTKQLVQVKVLKGSHWGHLGHNVGNTKYLLPEEALYLMECNCLYLTYNKVPVSIQQAYKLLLSNNTIGLKEYKVYSSLSRLGYKITRYKGTPTDKPPGVTDDYSMSLSVNANESKTIEKSNEIDLHNKGDLTHNKLGVKVVNSIESGHDISGILTNKNILSNGDINMIDTGIVNNSNSETIEALVSDCENKLLSYVEHDHTHKITIDEMISSNVTVDTGIISNKNIENRKIDENLLESEISKCSSNSIDDSNNLTVDKSETSDTFNVDNDWPENVSRKCKCDLSLNTFINRDKHLEKHENCEMLHSIEQNELITNTSADSITLPHNELNVITVENEVDLDVYNKLVHVEHNSSSPKSANSLIGVSVNCKNALDESMNNALTKQDKTLNNSRLNIAERGLGQSEDRDISEGSKSKNDYIDDSKNESADSETINVTVSSSSDEIEVGDERENSEINYCFVKPIENNSSKDSTEMEIDVVKVNGINEPSEDCNCGHEEITVDKHVSNIESWKNMPLVVIEEDEINAEKDCLVLKQQKHKEECYLKPQKTELVQSDQPSICGNEIYKEQGETRKVRISITKKKDDTEIIDVELTRDLDYVPNMLGKDEIILRAPCEKLLPRNVFYRQNPTVVNLKTIKKKCVQNNLTNNMAVNGYRPIGNRDNFRRSGNTFYNQIISLYSNHNRKNFINQWRMRQIFQRQRTPMFLRSPLFVYPRLNFTPFGFLNNISVSPQNIPCFQTNINFQTHNPSNWRCNQTMRITQQAAVETISLDDEEEVTKIDDDDCQIIDTGYTRKRNHNSPDNKMEEHLNNIKQIAQSLKQVNRFGYAYRSAVDRLYALIVAFNRKYDTNLTVDHNFEVNLPETIVVDSSSDSDCVVDDDNQHRKRKRSKTTNYLNDLNVIPSTSTSSSNFNDESKIKYTELKRVFHSWLPPDNDFGRPALNFKNTNDYLVERFLLLDDYLTGRYLGEFRNWKEIKEDFERRLEECDKSDIDEGSNEPMKLVTDQIQPLLKLEDCKSMSTILERLRVIKKVEHVSQVDNNLKITFNVYDRETKSIRKNEWLEPLFRLICVSMNESIPKMYQLNTLRRKCGHEASLFLAVVGFDSISYIDVQSANLPVYIKQTNVDCI